MKYESKIEIISNFDKNKLEKDVNNFLKILEISPFNINYQMSYNKKVEQMFFSCMIYYSQENEKLKKFKGTKPIEKINKV